MMNNSHHTAKPSHYDEEAEEYDLLNEENSRQINQVLDEIFKRHQVKTVLDLTCGTGSQVFWLTKCGYQVTGSDINPAMLKIAKEKARKEQLGVKLLEGDMRSLRVGQFDTVITIFNAIGHLTKNDFEVAIRNIHENLNEGGLYVFDIFNLAYLLNGDNITELTIDWVRDVENKKVRKVQYSTINKDGILASYTTSLVQVGDGLTQKSENTQTLQIYTAEQLRILLKNNGFDVIAQTEIDGKEFVEDETERILTVAKKI